MDRRDGESKQDAGGDSAAGSGPPATAAHDDADIGPFPADDIFDALADEYRRYVLYHLRKHERATLTRLADIVAGWVNAQRAEPVTAEEQLDIYTDLYHVHLPKLADANLVTYDEPDEGGVELAQPPEYVGELLDAALELDGGTGTSSD